MNRRTLLWSAAAMLLSGTSGAALWRARAAEPLPAMPVALLDGTVINFDFRGTPRLVTFWASNCPKCLAELPQLAQLHGRLAAQGAGLLAVAVYWDDPQRTAEIARQHALPYPIAIDPSGDIARAFGRVTATPTSFVVDPQGRIVRRVVGAIDFPDFERELVALASRS